MKELYWLLVLQDERRFLNFCRMQWLVARYDVHFLGLLLTIHNTCGVI